MQRVRTTGSAAPARVGGHRRPLLAPRCAVGVPRRDRHPHPNGQALRPQSVPATSGHGRAHGHWRTTTFVAGLRQTGDIAPLVLPGPHALAEKHGDCAGAAQLSFEKRRPGLAGRQPGAIEEAGDAGFAQGARTAATA
jgi:hypothetical protein